MELRETIFIDACPTQQRLSTLMGSAHRSYVDGMNTSYAQRIIKIVSLGTSDGTDQNDRR